MDKAQDVLSKEELEFLLSPLTDGESQDLSTHGERFEDEDEENGGQTQGEAEHSPQCEKNAWQPRTLEEDDVADANPVLWARAEFLASLLEEELGSATRAHMRARPLSLAVGFPEDLAERSAAPAFFALLAAGKSDIVFACNPLTTQALADASLGAGHMSLQPRGTLSYFDKELVRRCLDGLPQMIERAFALPPCKMSRIVWSATSGSTPCAFPWPLTALPESASCCSPWNFLQKRGEQNKRGRFRLSRAPCRIRRT